MNKRGNPFTTCKLWTCRTKGKLLTFEDGLCQDQFSEKEARRENYYLVLVIFQYCNTHQEISYRVAWEFDPEYFADFVWVLPVELTKAVSFRYTDPDKLILLRAKLWNFVTIHFP